MIGKKLAHYEITARIGSGGMGDVYRARDTKLGRDVALKVLPEEMAQDGERRRRFEQEARVIATLKHPNIVTIYSVEEADGLHFLTMELIEGSSLEEVIATDGLPLNRFFAIATALADAIASAHGQGITHRDLKPANIMIDPDGRVKVLDFGLAKLLQQTETDETVVGGGDTEPGYVLGTASYMSPEQAEGKPVDHRSDIFSLGIVMYEMATGERPFKGDSRLSIMSSILRDMPPTVSEIKRTLPNQLGRIIQHCLAKDPGRRFQSALDIRNELEELRTEVDSQTGQARAISFPARPNRKRALVVVAGVIVIAAAAIFGSGLFRRDGGGVAVAEANSLAIFPFDNLKNPEDPERFGQILQELLITDLSSLEAVKVFSSQRLFDIQKQLGADAAGNGRSVASRVASDAGATTMLTGTLSQLGDKWILTCQVVDVQQGTIVQSKRIDGTDLYTMVDQLTQEFQREFDIGEPVDVAQKIPVKEKTSASLEAYRHYLTGVDHLNSSQFNEAVSELQRAVAIDPSFGQAYYKLGVATWWNTNASSAGKEYLEHLLENKLYASQKEKRMAETMLHLVQRHWGDALPVAEKLAEDYPDEKEAWYALGEAMYHFPGGSKQVESKAAFNRAVALDPDFELAYRHIFDIISEQKQFDDGIELADERIVDDPDNPWWYRERAAMIARKGDEAETARAVAEALARCKTREDQRELYKLMAGVSQMRGRSDEAIVYFQKALDADPGHNDPAIARNMIQLLSAQQKFDECERVIRQRLEKNPDDADMLEWLLVVHRNRCEFAAARKLASELIVKQPDNARWYRHLVRYSINSGDETVAQAAIDRAVQHTTSTDDRRVLFDMIADAYGDCGNWNTAISYMKKAMEVDDRHQYPGQRQTMGFAELNRCRLVAAERWFEEALALDTKNIGSLFGMAVLSHLRGDTAAAGEYIERAIDAVPVEWVTPYARAWHHIMSGNNAAADAALRAADALVISPTARWDLLTEPPPNIGLGWNYLQVGQYDRAERVFVDATSYEMARRNPRALEGLGWTLLCKGEDEAAAQRFEEGLGIGFSHGGILRGLATLELLAGRLADAQEYAERSLREDVPHADSRRLLGYIYAAQGRYDEAQAVARSVVAMDSTRESHALMAWVLISGDVDVQEGMEAAEAALALPVNGLFMGKDLAYWAPAEYSMGIAYLKSGDPRKAVEYLEKATARQPGRAAIQQDLARAREAADRKP